MADLIPRDLHVDPPPMIEILSREHVLQAWEWWISSISLRPEVNHGASCVFDLKNWFGNPLIASDPEVISRLAELYTITLLGDPSEILQLSLGNGAQPIYCYSQTLESSYRSLLSENPEAEIPRDRFKRFRHSFSEHLAFWVQLAYLSTNRISTEYAIYMPNVLPEDSGPDGMAIIKHEEKIEIVEIRSAKSSVADPEDLIASASFKREGKPVDGKQLDEFFKIVHERFSFAKLERMLDAIGRQINLSTSLAARSYILGSASKLNATVIADAQFASYEKFDSFYRVLPDPGRCIAVYIGADNWVSLADAVQDKVTNILQKSGVY